MKRGMRFSTLKKRLEKKFPGIDVWYNEDGFFISAESGTMYKDWPLADYYDAPYYDPEEKLHIFGVHRALHDFLEKLGFGHEWQNPGALAVYKDF